ncbi:tuberin-like [Haliotis rubra]|uniref:tuberin-like n=1 Tax=Haliotis rubra TaxID=36100 RepID=UPI001EE5F5DD|nr:tuberin-like [Haliotis rubra]
MSRPESDLKERLKNLFKFSRAPSAPSTAHRTQTKDIVLTPDVLREICPESPANNRIRTIRDLSDTVKKKRLEENAIEALWKNISDLLQPQVTTESRQVALHFLKCLLEGQLQNLGILRGHFFKVIEALTGPDDLSHRLDLFRVLSENGKNLHDFEDETGPFLLKWMSEVISAGYISNFLSLLINVIKYNAAYLYEDEVAGLVQQTCMIPNSTRLDEEHNLKLCLAVLDSVVSYSYLPTSALYHFVAALCHMVNKPKFCDDSWELMRKLLGTHLGHSAVYTMCCMLQDSKLLADCLLLRGAVFFIGMALWGAHRVSSLRNTPTSVLPSFRQVLSTSDWLVAYEVTKSVQRLVRKYGKDQQHITWDILLDIIEIILKQLHTAQLNGAVPDSAMQCQLEVHDVLSAVEELHRHGHFLGSPHRFFTILELCSNKRSESSVEMLMEYQAQAIHPGKEQWMQSLNHLMDKYFRQESRTGIRKKALDILSHVLSINKHVYESDLIERVVLPHLGHIEMDPDPDVRKVTVEMLLVLAQDCKTGEFQDIMAVVEKVIRKPLSTFPAGGEMDVSQPVDEALVVDVKTAVLKLCDVFKHRLYIIPSNYCVRIYRHLIAHVNTHYVHGYTGYSASCIRQAVMELLLQLRSDSFHRIGFTEVGQDGPCPFSPYITCKQRDDMEEEAPSSPVTAAGVTPSPWYQPPAILQYSEAFKLYITCLQHELDWHVLKCVLEYLPLVLQNKTLILTTTDNMVATLCHRLCAMVNDRSLGFLEKLQRLPSKLTRSDFHSYVFPVLATMVTYHDYLDRNGQKELLKCLEFGLVSKCAKTCVSALRISALEMQEVMMRLLPSVLLSLSKISATMSMAIPVLAFLSSIVRLPNLYANFVEDQYMSVFAIALPYTNPFKFSHYTVSLAHHVIAIWFVRCRLPFRKGFVKFIHKGLRANVLQQFEENSVHNLQNQDNRNQDSTNRIRSGSYSEGGRVRRRMVSGSAVTKRDPPPVDEKMTLFHRELTETCTDVMARYTFANFAAVPHRSQLVQFLLSGTQNQTWLLGNKIITITTSGSGIKAANAGVCEKCIMLYHEAQEARKPLVKRERRRHKSAACLSRSQSQVEPASSPCADDSAVLQTKWSHDDLSVTRGSDDVGVQTGSSLSGDSLDSYLFWRLLGVLSAGRTFHEPISTISACAALRRRLGFSGGGGFAPIPPLGAGAGSVEDSWGSVPCAALPHESGGVGSARSSSRVSGLGFEWCVGSGAGSSFGSSLSSVSGARLPTGSGFGSSSRGDLVSDSGSGAESMDVWEVEEPEGTFRFSSAYRTYEEVYRNAMQQVQKVSRKRSPSAPSLLPCTCWCIGWAEVNIRGPSGNVSWVMRIENEISSSAASREVSLQDITMLFKPMPEEWHGNKKGGRKIDSESLGEEEYESLYSKHFSAYLDDSSMLQPAGSPQDELVAVPASPSCSDHSPLVTSNDHSTDEAADTGMHFQSPHSIRKTSSSPSLFGSYSEESGFPDQMNYDRPVGGTEVVLEHNAEVASSLHTVGRAAEEHAGGVPTEGTSLRDGQTDSSPLELIEEYVANSQDSLLQWQQQAASSSQDSSVQDEVADLPPVKKRGHTISVMSPAQDVRQLEDTDPKGGKAGRSKEFRGGVSPSFVFLQLFHNHPLFSGSDTPVLLPQTETINRALRMLDHIHPYETHKIGVIYVGPNQVTDEKGILCNLFGSPRYARFVQGLGELIHLQDVDPDRIYVGGLALTGSDGRFAYSWQDESMQVIFHVATLMPNRESDPNCNAKKLHIGNDFVTIVYNDSGEDYKMGTIKGQFNYVNIVIRPLDYESNAVTLQTKEEPYEFKGQISTDIADILGHTDTKIISDSSLALLVRQIAMHCNLASMVLQRQQSQPQDPFASNWLERLRQIKRHSTKS